MDFYQRALALKEETVAHRRYFHETAEVGLDMPKAREYLMQKLAECGLSPIRCGEGVTAELGHGEKTLLLRADMDALPMPEESGEPFACKSGCQAHACGHDLHAAMLLTAAKLLKENESLLKGRVRFMFQPAEETFEGSKNMMEHGVLEGVNAALAFHVLAGKTPIGMFMYNAGGVMMNSVDGFRVEIQGRGAHGAYPNLAVDPLHTAAQIYLALEGLIAREADPEKTCVLTVGNFHGGSAPNIIPDVAFLEGTLRTNDPANRALLVRRIGEVSKAIAAMNGAEAKVTALSAVPPLMCDKAFTSAIVRYMGEMTIPGLTGVPDMHANASEDFAAVAEKVPAAFIYLSAGFSDERGDYFAHNPKVRFNEEALPMGAAALAHCAVRWLEEQVKQ